MNKLYAGIGSRNTPSEVCGMMTRIAIWLAEQGYILRSGGAQGADKAFEAGAKGKEVLRPNDCLPWARSRASDYNPNLFNMKSYVQNLLGRNMQIILGREGNEPVKFVICWAESETQGGTSYGIRLARDNNIPVFNIFNITDKRDLHKLLLSEINKFQ
jgi:hypothetical protein